MPTSLDTLVSYLPVLLVQRYRARTTPLVAPDRYMLRTAVLFADISGFTTLAERLAGRGPSGTEELTRTLNIMFGQILDLIATHGGDVVKFAGDALLALWPASDEPLEHAALRASQCAQAIHERMQSFYRLIDSVRLTLRIGIAAGDVTAMQIGGVYGRWEFLLAGEPLIEVGRAERLARPGDLVLAPSAWRLLTARCDGATIDGQPDFMRCEQIRAPLPAQAAARPPLGASTDLALRAFIPGAVLSRLVAGQTSWLAELRRVTVLFVSLPGLDLASSLEQAQLLMREIQTAIYRYEGSVNKLSFDDKGTTLVAAMGLPPLAHEDDAARGMLAALAIVQTIGELGQSCAIGVASGRAFCGEIGTAYRREYTTIGDVVNTAARLMQAAGQSAVPGPAIICDEATHQLARARIAFEQLLPLSVKGKAEPLAVFRPIEELRASSAIPQLVPHPHGTLIGRMPERAALAEQLQLLLRGDMSAAVIIEGEAGMGKSMLLEHISRQANELHISVLLGVGSATERHAPYHAWRAIFSQLFEISSLGSYETRQAQVQLLLQPEELELAPLLNAVLPLELPDNALTARLEGPRRAQATSDLLLRLLQRWVARAPQLILLEDAHWLDTASWELALQASQRVRPLLMVITLRPLGDQPGDAPMAPAQQLLAAAPIRLRLDTLTPEETLELVRLRLGVAALPAPVAELIMEKTQGHPFFSEELAYALRDSGLIQIVQGICRLAPEAKLDGLAFPDTIQGVIISRIDRLSSTQQLTLKVASVIGRVFPLRTLEAIYPIATDIAHLSDDLAALARLDITPLEAPEPEVAYIFKHAITQDVVYDLMLFAQRRQLHRAVAEWYERAYANDLSWLYPLLAYHWEKAGAVEQALVYWEKAGRSALAISALHEALSAFTQALGLLERPTSLAPEAVARQQIAIAQQLGKTQQLLGDFAAAQATLLRSLEQGRAVADSSSMSAALNMLGLISTDRGDYARARAELNEALELARTANDHPHTARVLSNLGNIAMREAAYDESERFYQESLALFTAIGDHAGTAQVLNGMGNGAVDREMYDVARYCYEESLAIRRATGDRWGIGICLSNLGWVTHLQHDYPGARAFYEESLAIARAIGDQRGTAIVLNNLGFTLCEMQENQAAQLAFEEALVIGSEIGITPLLLEILVGVARLRAQAGQALLAAELLGLAQAHPASNSDVSFQARRFLAELAGQLPPSQLDAAVARGSQLALEQVVDHLIKQQ